MASTPSATPRAQIARGVVHERLNSFGGWFDLWPRTVRLGVGSTVERDAHRSLAGCPCSVRGSVRAGQCRSDQGSVHERVKWAAGIDGESDRRQQQVGALLRNVVDLHASHPSAHANVHLSRDGDSARHGLLLSWCGDLSWREGRAGTRERGSFIDLARRSVAQYIVRMDLVPTSVVRRETFCRAYFHT